MVAGGGCGGGGGANRRIYPLAPAEPLCVCCVRLKRVGGLQKAAGLARGARGAASGGTDSSQGPSAALLFELLPTGTEGCALADAAAFIRSGHHVSMGERRDERPTLLLVLQGHA